MLETQFLLTNAHFTINLLVALVCFSVAWLYFDAWLGRHDIREGTKMLGFMLLSLSFVAHATQIDKSILENPILGSDTLLYLTTLFRTLGYLVLIFGQLIDPLQPLPSYRKSATQKGFGINKSAAVVLALPFSGFAFFIYPVLAAVTAFLYIRRATAGLEFHLRTIGYSFTLLSISELLSTASSFQYTSNVDIESLVKAFGPLWIAEHVFLIFFMVILGIWVWGYLMKRLETELFIIFTTTTLVIFLITAIFFTNVSLGNQRRDILRNLEINVSVLQFSIDSKKNETLSDAQLIAQNPDVISAIDASDRKKLADIAVTSLLAKKQAYLIIVSKTGEILARGNDPEKIGGSLSDDPLIKKSLAGNDVSGVVTTEGVMAPAVSVRSVVQIKKGGDLIGAALVGQNIDNTFVDTLKNATGLDTSIYGDNIRSATTFISPDGKSRWVGIKEETSDIKKTVLLEGKPYSGKVNILNVPYLATFTPLKNSDDTPIGMLFVGRPKIATIKATSALIEQTFLVTVVLLVISVFPSYFISKYIVDQLR